MTAVPHSKGLHHDPAITMQSLSIPQKTEQKSATPLISYAKKTSQLNNAGGMSQKFCGLKQLSDGDGDYMRPLGGLGRSLPTQILQLILYWEATQPASSQTKRN